MAKLERISKREQCRNDKICIITELPEINTPVKGVCELPWESDNNISNDFKQDDIATPVKSEKKPELIIRDSVTLADCEDGCAGKTETRTTRQLQAEIDNLSWELGESSVFGLSLDIVDWSARQLTDLASFCSTQKSPEDVIWFPEPVSVSQGKT